MSKKNLILIFSGVIALIGILCTIFIFTNNKENKISTYKVTFDSNGGNPIKEQIVNEGEKATKPTDPTKDGYLFVEWLYNNDTFNFAIKIDKDINLIAKWQEVEEETEMVTVKFETDGGTTISNQIIESGTKITKPEAPTKEGYIFKGWYHNEEEFNFDTPITEDIEIKAKWEKEQKEEKPKEEKEPEKEEKPIEEKYTVTFNSNDGSEVKKQEVKKDSKATKPSNPTKDGYVFINWTLDGKEYNFDTKITNNITLVANWRLFGDVNNDSSIDSIDLLYIRQYIEGIKIFTEIQKLVADVNIDRVVDDVDVHILAKYISDGGTKQDGYNIKLPYVSGTKYTIKYNLNGGITPARNTQTYVQVSLPYKLDNPEKEGYAFIGWTGSNGNIPQINIEIPKGTTGNLEYKANWLLYGDLNNDGLVDVYDLINIKQYIDGIGAFTENQKLVADVNLDGKVDNKDVDIIAKFIAGDYGIKLPYTS